MKPLEIDFTKDSQACLAEDDVIVISSDEESSYNNKGKTTHPRDEEKEFGGSYTPAVGDSKSNVQLCKNCTQKYENIEALKAHILNDRSCFFPLTKHYWFNKKNLCRLCRVKLMSPLMLKRHCFENIECRQRYIGLFMRDSKPKKGLIPTVNNATASSSQHSHHSGSSEACVITTTTQVPEPRDNSNNFLHSAEVTVNSQDKRSEPSHLHDVGTSSERNGKTSAMVPTKETVWGINVNRRQLRNRQSGKIMPCSDCGEQCRSLNNSAHCRCLQTAVCLCCKKEFPNEGTKTIHLTESWNCQVYLKEKFLNGEFSYQAEICQDYYLNKDMCHFCLFTCYDGNVFDHILNVLECRKKFEEAVLRNETLESEEVIPQHFSCDKCSESFNSRSSLRAHKSKMHYDSSKKGKMRREKKQNDGHHLFCFRCQKFLKSEAEVINHSCPPTRLLSRFWYRKAVWNEGEFQCNCCSDKYFHWKRNLEIHMRCHENRISPLFKAITHFKKQKEVQNKSTSKFSNTTGEISGKVYHCEPLESTKVSDAVNSNVRIADVSSKAYVQPANKCHLSIQVKNSLLKNKRLQNSNKSFTCDKCQKIFHMPEVFKFHVLVKQECLLYYESPRNKSQLVVNFCFRCKVTFANREAFRKHACRGVVPLRNKCQRCQRKFLSVTSLRNHTKFQHRTDKPFEKSEQSHVSSTTETPCSETIYNCCSCLISFQHSCKFVQHIFQMHSYRYLK